LGLAAVARTLTSVRDASACGDGAEYEEEEVLDLASGSAPSARELSRYVVPRADAPARRRFATTPDASVICYADRESESFVAESIGGERVRFAAPNGGIPRFRGDGQALFLQIDRGDAYTKLVFANPHSGDSEVWDDFFKAEPFALAPSGVIVAHEVPSGGALSWLTGRERTIELARTAEVPKHLSVKGASVAYFVGGEAFALELGEETPPRHLGTLPEPATGAVLTGDGFVATSAQGAWLLSERTKPRLLFGERGLAEPVFHAGTLAVHGAYRARFFRRGGGFSVLEAPHGNLHFVGPDAGTGSFLVCRGPRVESYEPKLHQLTHVARGREGMKLRGAARFGHDVLTWSSRTWLLVRDERSALPPPVDFVLE